MSLMGDPGRSQDRKMGKIAKGVFHLLTPLNEASPFHQILLNFALP